MKNKKITLLGLTALTLTIFALTAVFRGERVEANEQNSSKYQRKQKPEMENQKNKMIQILEEKDYEAWVELLKSKPGSEEWEDKINKENFNLMIETHEARKAKDWEKLREIKEQIDLPKPRRRSRSKFFLGNCENTNRKVENLPDGVSITITSENEELVTKIQERAQKINQVCQEQEE